MKISLVAFLLFDSIISKVSAGQPILSEKILNKSLHPSEIQEIFYRNVRGIGKKDAIVFYLKPDATKEFSTLCGVAVFGQNQEVLWKHEVGCYGAGVGDLIYLEKFEKGKPFLPFIRLTHCHNGSIGCGTILFRWNGKTFEKIFDDREDDGPKFEIMPDGRPVLIRSYRNREIPTIWAYEKREMVNCSRNYPDFYLPYIKKAYDALKTGDIGCWTGIEWAYLPAFIYGQKYKEGLEFCRKLRPVLKNCPDRSVDELIAKLKKWEASFENPHAKATTSFLK